MYLKVDGFEGCGEKRKLSGVESRPAISSHELITSGVCSDLGSGLGSVKIEPRVKRGGGVVVGEEDGSRVRRP